MRKYIIILFIGIVTSSIVSAQTVVRSLDDNSQSTNSVPQASTTTSKVEPTPSSSTVKKETGTTNNSKDSHSKGGIELAVNGWNTVYMVDLAVTGNWWYAAIAPTWGTTSEYIKDSKGFRLGGGVHKRFHVANFVYFDGRLGLHYLFSRINSYDGEHTKSIGSWGGSVTVRDFSYKNYSNGAFTFRPCIGFDLFKIHASEFSIFLAYEGVVSFSGGYGNSWSTGICFGF